MSKISEDYFKPEKVHDHFMEITKRSHPSCDENDVRTYVKECAGKIPNVDTVFYDPDATDPGQRVIVLRRAGSGKYSEAPYVTLQAHMDMVCYPDNNIFPLKVFGYDDIEGEKWIKAGDEASISDPEKGTTLGADDGIGVATALAILEDENLREYPIECLFTVQEETNMGGAKGFDKDLLISPKDNTKSKKYINLDAEDAPIIIYGSAGGCDVEYDGTVERSDMEDGFVALKVSISGLRGGHSGININSGRLNAIKVLSEVLIRLNGRITNLDVVDDIASYDPSYDLRLVSMERNEKPNMNSIPSQASAVIVIPQGQEENFIKDFIAYCSALKALYQPEEGKFSWQVCWSGDVLEKPLSKLSTDAILCLLQQIPHGVIRMIPNKDLVNVVETSTNLANIDMKEDTVVIQASNRSSNDKSMLALKNIQRSVGDCFNYSVMHTGGYPSWQPNESSELLGIAKCVYKDIYRDDCDATVIHAGLECTYIVQKYDNEIDCISIGPTIVDPHTGGERLKASTVETFYSAVTQIINKIFSEDK